MIRPQKITKNRKIFIFFLIPNSQLVQYLCDRVSNAEKFAIFGPPCENVSGVIRDRARPVGISHAAPFPRKKRTISYGIYRIILPRMYIIIFIFVHTHIMCPCTWVRRTNEREQITIIALTTRAAITSDRSWKCSAAWESAFRFSLRFRDIDIVWCESICMYFKCDV